MNRLTATVFALLALVEPALAQGPRGRLLVTVADMTGAVIPSATVRVTGVEDATKAGDPRVAQTGSDGVATFAALRVPRR